MSRSRAITASSATLLVLLSVGPTAQPAAAAFESADERVVEAIVSAVRVKIGQDAEVAVDDLRTRADFGDVTGIVAVLPSDIRLGTRTRVALKGLRDRARGVRVGEAECVIRARAPHYEVIAVVARNAEITASSVQLVDGLLPPVRLGAPAVDVVNARALRDLAPGDILFAHDVAVPPAVRSGDTVVTQLTCGGIRVTLEAVAAQDGHRGEIIRIVNPSSGKVLRARVVGPRTVEVTHGT